MPTTLTNQNLEVLGYLQHVGPLTPIEALRELGVFRLAARIYDLRAQGVAIKTERKVTRGGARVAVYKLVA